MSSKTRKIASWAVLIAALLLFAGFFWVVRCRIEANPAAVTNAAEQGDWTTVMRLVRWRSSLANETDSQGHKLIHLAVSARRADVVAFLAAHGADLNALTAKGLSARDWADKTPLTLAIEQRDAQMVELLLKKGADPNACAHAHKWESTSTGTGGPWNITWSPHDYPTYPLPYARSLGLHDIEALLKKYGAKEPPATPVPAPAAAPAPGGDAGATMGTVR